MFRLRNKKKNHHVTKGLRKHSCDVWLKFNQELIFEANCWRHTTDNAGHWLIPVPAHFVLRVIICLPSIIGLASKICCSIHECCPLMAAKNWSINLVLSVLPAPDSPLKYKHRIVNEIYSKTCLTCLIWFFTSHQQPFSYKGTGLPGLNQY